MFHNGMGKGTSRRTAFGDVSNVANSVRPSKDDSLLIVKGGLKVTEKTSAIQDEKKALPFQKPAQRPLSIPAGIKGFVSNVTGNARQAIAKQPLADIQKAIQPVRSLQNEVGKQNIEVSTAPLSKPDEKFNRVHGVSKAPKAPLPPVHRQLPPLPVPASTSRITIDPHIQQIGSKKLDKEPALSVEQFEPKEQPLSEGKSAVRSDGLYIDADGGIQVYEFEDAPEAFEEKVITLMDQHGTSAIQNLLLPIANEANRAVVSQSTKPNLDTAQKQMLAPVSEPEEYWDEDAADNYEEEGYVTARSFKSRADTTTGNATTILFPKMTQKVKKEIAAAKELVEKTKTVEELEDEAWDTTMVAEYGEEIFQYMKEMEVSITQAQPTAGC